MQDNFKAEFKSSPLEIKKKWMIDDPVCKDTQNYLRMLN